jgi:hypothetical protein
LIDQPKRAILLFNIQLTSKESADDFVTLPGKKQIVAREKEVCSSAEMKTALLQTN